MKFKKILSQFHDHHSSAGNCRSFLVRKATVSCLMPSCLLCAVLVFVVMAPILTGRTVGGELGNPGSVQSETVGNGLVPQGELTANDLTNQNLIEDEKRQLIQRAAYSEGQETTVLGVGGASSETSKSEVIVRLVICSFQFLFIGCLLIDLQLRRKEISTDKAVQQFMKYLVALWLVMVILYFEKSLVQGFILAGWLAGEDYSTYTIDALIANIAPALFFVVFLILDVPSLRPNDPFRRYRRIILLLLLVVEAIAVLAYRFSGLRGISDWVGSFWAGLAIAFLAGKLDSKVISIRRRYVAITYFYALMMIWTPALNPNYPGKWFGNAVLLLALLGKLTLFVIILDLLKDKRIEEYLLHLRRFYPFEKGHLRSGTDALTGRT